MHIYAVVVLVKNGTITENDFNVTEGLECVILSVFADPSTSPVNQE